MSYISRQVDLASGPDEDWTDDEGWADDAMPDDGREAWFSLLLISLIASAAATFVYAILRAVSA